MAWTKRQRFEAVAHGEMADRPPISAWRHFIDKEHSGPEDLAEAMLAFQKKCDWDFLKMQPRAVYYEQAWGNEYNFEKYNGLFVERTKTMIQDKKDLEKITELSGIDGVFAEQIESVHLIRKDLDQSVPLLQTVFSPAGILSGLCGDASIGRYREAPREKSVMIRLIMEDKARVHKTLESIARTIAKYVAAVLASGADGFFFAALGLARTGFLTEAEWKEFVKPYDLIVLEALKPGITMLHTCGIYSNPEWFTDYPINILHWAESAYGNPPLRGSSAWLMGKVAMGGIDERLFGQNAEQEIAQRTKKTIACMKAQPFILTPDCSLAFTTSDAELHAFRNAVE